MNYLLKWIPSKFKTSDLRGFSERNLHVKSLYCNDEGERDFICAYDCTAMSFACFSYHQH